MHDRGGFGMMGGGSGMPRFDGGGLATQITLLTLADAGAETGDVLPTQVDPTATPLAIDPSALPRTRFVVGMRMGRGTINGVSFEAHADAA